MLRKNATLSLMVCLLAFAMTGSVYAEDKFIVSSSTVKDGRILLKVVGDSALFQLPDGTWKQKEGPALELLDGRLVRVGNIGMPPSVFCGEMERRAACVVEVDDGRIVIKNPDGMVQSLPDGSFECTSEPAPGAGKHAAFVVKDHRIVAAHDLNPNDLRPREP